MKSPGINVRRIKQVNGQSGFNEAAAPVVAGQRSAVGKLAASPSGRGYWSTLSNMHTSW